MNDDIINILNLKLSDVHSCTSKRISNQLSYYVTLTRNKVLCRQCGSKLIIKDYQLRKIKHQIIRDTDTTIFYRARRYYCPHPQATHLEYNPFSPRNSNLSDMTIISILKFLKEPVSTFALTSRQFNVSNSRVVELFDTYCQMDKLHLTRAICIDEFYAIRKSKEKYVCLIIDFETGNILDVMFGRTKNNWIRYAQYLSDEERKRVDYVSIDMFETYRFAAHQYFKNAKLCVDSFHVVKNINEILKNVRIAAMKKYERKDKEGVPYDLLKHFNWLIMCDSNRIIENKPKYNKKLRRYINYPQLLEEILKTDPTLKEAYKLKEEYLLFNSHTDKDHAREELAHIIQLYINSSIEGYRSFASSTLIGWFDEIVNSFDMIAGKRISNGKIESTNSRVKTILKVANGFKNFSRMRNKIMYCLNRDSLITIREEHQSIRCKSKVRGPYKKN